MTALVFTIQPEQICIAMDTLVISADDRTPLHYQTKIMSFPRLNLVVAGTGHSLLVSHWWHFLNTNILATDIDNLNQYCQNALLSIEGNCQDADCTDSTIYHFGYSPSSERYVGFAYRSTNDWKPEALADGLGIKPVISIAPFDDLQLPATFIDIISQQRSEDQLKPNSFRVGIGGQIEFAVMENGSINISTVHKFESYESDYAIMVERLNA